MEPGQVPNVTTSISAPKLSTSPGAFLLELDALTSVDFSTLSTVGSDGWLLRGLPQLTAASLPELVTVDGQFTFTSCTSLDTATAPQLTSSALVQLGQVVGNRGAPRMCARK